MVVAFMCLDLAVAGVAAAERSPAADVYFERGVRALRQGEAADAVEDLAEAARLAPGDAAVLSRYAQALLAAGKPNQALAALAPFGSRAAALRGLGLFALRRKE